jgi:hypothetical protein
VARGGQRLHGIDEVLDDALQLTQFAARFHAVVCRLAICGATPGSGKVSSLDAGAPFVHDFTSSKTFTARVAGQYAP